MIVVVFILFGRLFDLLTRVGFMSLVFLRACSDFDLCFGRY